MASQCGFNQGVVIHMHSSSTSLHAPETVSGYCFHPQDLRVRDRQPGVSAFTRTKNGEDFIELTIRSHIPFFDEIVAVHNSCTDRTASILLQLQAEFGADKLRVIHYLDPVFPQGCQGHANTQANDPSSVVNYSNFALAATKYSVVTKLDDDHLAIPQMVQAEVDAIRAAYYQLSDVRGFSGLNLIRERNGQLAICRQDAVSGSGDIGFFRVTPHTYFTHDRRFERFRCKVPRRFAGFLYWHLKYLKQGLGFNNYDLAVNTDSRFARKKVRLENSTQRGATLQEAASRLSPSVTRRLAALVSDKYALMLQRDLAIKTLFPDDSVLQAVLRTTDPRFHADILSWAGQPLLAKAS